MIEKNRKNFFLYDRKTKADMPLSALTFSEVRHRLLDFMSIFKRRGKLYVGDLFDENPHITENFKPLFCYEILYELAIEDGAMDARSFLGFGGECADIFTKYLRQTEDYELATAIRTYIFDYSEENDNTKGFKEYIKSKKEHIESKMLGYAKKNIEKFRERINAYAAANMSFMPAPEVVIDLKLQPKALSTAIPDMLKVLEPYGAGNSMPVFGLYCMKIQSITPVGGGNHLRISVVRDNVSVNCMKFSTTVYEFPYKVGDMVDIACVLENKIYKGSQNLSVYVKEIRETGVDDEVYLKSYRLYERTKTKEPMEQGEALSIRPTREDLAEIYRFIRAMAGFKGSVYRFINTFPGQTIGKVLFSLDVMSRNGLISVKTQGDSLEITLLPVKGKVDIMASSLFDNIKIK